MNKFKITDLLNKTNLGHVFLSDIEIDICQTNNLILIPYFKQVKSGLKLTSLRLANRNSLKYS